MSKQMKVNRFGKSALVSALLLAMSQPMMAYADTSDKERIQALEEKVDALTDMLESKSETGGADGHHGATKWDRVHIGGYGEMHYNQLKGDDIEKRGIDFHRLVLFVGYDFSETARLVTELEIEHAVASASKAGEVEVEQAYLEFDFGEARDKHLKTGIILMPVGVVNETHEPATFYGVERPIIETTLLPSTWWAGGVMFSQTMKSGISYDLFLSEGLKTKEGDAFNLKGGKQKTTSEAGAGGRADAFDLATTARIKYTGVPGLELAAYAQYQPDLDQSAKKNYADSATMFGAHAIYQVSDFKMTGLYTQWNLDGDLAKADKKDKQAGGYLELSYRPVEKWGVFVRQSEWEKKQGEKASQTDMGVNFWPLPELVFKADVQFMNKYAAPDSDWDKGVGGADAIVTKATAFNLGMGYQF